MSPGAQTWALKWGLERGRGRVQAQGQSAGKDTFVRKCGIWTSFKYQEETMISLFFFF